MPVHETPSVSVSRRGPRCLGSDPRRTVVWVRGEHDVATRVNLCNTIAEAAGLDDADIVVDLSHVTFMDASTIDTLVAARQRLGTLARSLSVRAPSHQARRLLDLCGLADLIDEQPTLELPAAATALGSWVDVPTQGRGADLDQPPIDDDAPPVEPIGVSVRRHAQLTGSFQHDRTAS